MAQIIPKCCVKCISLDYDHILKKQVCDLKRILPTKKQTCEKAIYLESHGTYDDKQHGGYRPGAGRKKIDNPRVQWSGYLSHDVVHFLRVQAKNQGFSESQSQLIDDAVRKMYLFHDGI